MDQGVAEQMPSTLFYREGQPLKMFSALAYHPPAFNAVRVFSQTLGADSNLTVREREIVILRVATVVGCPYEWDMHSELSLRRAWLDRTEIDALADRRLGAAQAVWSPREQMLVFVAEEIAGNATLTDRSWAEATEQLTIAEVVEATLWAGWYRLLAGVANAFAFASDEPLD